MVHNIKYKVHIGRIIQLLKIYDIFFNESKTNVQYTIE